MSKIMGDRYVLLSPIGKNNFDEKNNLYMAKDIKNNNNAVAVKLIEINENDDSDVKSELFKREFMSLSRLHHDSIIKYIDAGRENDILYLVMEYYDGMTLKKYITENSIDEENKLKIAINIAEALAYAHEKSVIHRDLKPDNIMINTPDEIRIIDFGISKIIGEKYDSNSTVKCYMTIKYAAPEQLLRLEAKAQSDIYSFGLNLAYILSEKEPPEEKDKIVEYIDQIRCSRDLKNLIIELTQFDENKRVKSMFMVKRRLEKEYNVLRAKTKKLFLKYSSYIQRKLCEMGMIDYLNKEHTKNFINKDLNINSSYIYRNTDKNKFFIIGNLIKYTCRQLRNGYGLEIEGIYCLDDQIEWDKETERGIPVSIPWTLIDNENDCTSDSYLAFLLQEIIVKEKTDRTKYNKNLIKNQLLEKWNRYLQEEFLEVDRKKRICNYRDFNLDETGYKIQIKIDEMDFEIKQGEVLQMTNNSNNQVTVGEFESLSDNMITIRLKNDINPSELSERGYIGIDIVQTKAILKRYARAMNTIRFSNTANNNLPDIISEPAVVMANDEVYLNKSDYIQEVLRNSPNSANAKAVRKVLGAKDIFLIQGPPGTGKSTVVTEIVCQILRMEPQARILLASQSHVAVDHVVNKVVKILPDKRIIRIGRTDRISDESQNLILSEQLNKWVEDVKKQSRKELLRYLQIRKGINVDDKDLQDENLSLDAMKEKYKNDNNEALFTLTNEWHRRLGKLEEFDEIFANKASIVAATCLGIASRNVLNEIDFDWVIVDEAARATPLELLVPIVRGKKIILVGDHRQLPPVVNTNINKLKLEEKGIKESDLEKSLFEELYDKMTDQAKMILTNQFRMHPDISKLISEVFYPAVNITTDIDKCERNHNLGWGPKSIKWIDTSNCKDNNETGDLLSKKNLLEARIILKELEHIEAVYKKKGIHNVSISIISGYEAQKNLLNNLINPNDAFKWTCLKIYIDNVDAFQGSETDITIYSLVRCNEENRIGFLYDERRLNVALSRGRNALIIVGNIKFAEKAKSFRGNPFIDLIRFFKKNTESCLLEVYNENK